jgi:NMD protein affecting ribosome stability and mRNA decay
MHLIPATDIVEGVIKEIRNGDIIELSGSLVNVQSDSDGWHWKSSQTRNDTGKGACELIWVDQLQIVTPLPL